MEIINKLTFDMAAAGMPPYIDAVQGDTFTRKVEVTLMTRGQGFDPSGGLVSVSVAFKKPDGTAGWYDTLPDGNIAATVISDGVYQVSLSPEMFTVHGNVYALFRFDLADKTISTFPFVVRVAENPSLNSTKSENYYNVQNWDSVNVSFDGIFDRLAKLERGGGVIDDENISTETTWSSQNIVDKLCPSFNESGATVTCTPLEGLPLEVVSHIVPKQSGSGDPSPSNIRPITGYDSIKLSRTGKNLFGGEAIADVFLAFGCTKDAENGIITIEPGKCDRTTPFFANFKENTQYTFIFYGRNTNANLALNHLNLCIRYTDGEEAEVFGNAPGTDQYVVVTSKAGKTVYGVQATWYNGNTILYYDKCGVFEGAVGLEAFEPYNDNSSTFTIDIGQTVYGGKFNWKTGELAISYASVVFDGVTSGKKVISTDGKYYAFSTPYPAPKVGGNICGDMAKCDIPIAKVVEVNVPEDITGVTDSDDASAVVSKINATLKSWYDAGTPLTCVYEIETPTTIQLTPQEILALSGTNVLSSSTGATEVSGKADPSAIIQHLYEELKGLTATMTALTGG